MLCAASYFRAILPDLPEPNRPTKTHAAHQTQPRPKPLLSPLWCMTRFLSDGTLDMAECKVEDAWEDSYAVARMALFSTRWVTRSPRPAACCVGTGTKITALRSRMRAEQKSAAQPCLDLYGPRLTPVWTCVDLCGPVWTCVDLSGPPLDLYGPV